MPEPRPERPVPPLQRLFDNPWLLLLLGVGLPFLSYTIWGWISMATIGDAKLP
jgi:hypothetical protein